MWWFPWENGSNPHKTPNAQPFSFISVAVIFFSNKNSTPLKLLQIAAVGELVWTICGKKWPARHSKLSTRAKIGKLQIFTSMDRARIHNSYYVNIGACQSWRPCSIHIFKTPFFLAQSAPSGIHVCLCRKRNRVWFCRNVKPRLLLQNLM